MLRSCFLSSFIEFLSAVSEEKSKNVSANQRPGQQSCFSDRPEKHKLGRGHWDLASCQVSLNSVEQFQRRSRKMSQPNRGKGRHLVFPIGPKNTNLVEDVNILLPVKFHWILLSSFRGEVEKCLSQTEARAAILFFRLARKTQTW